MTLNSTSFIDLQNKSSVSPDTLSPLDLAFAGDTVYDLLVREKLLSMGTRPVKNLHSLAVKEVCACAQAKAAELIMPSLTEEETAVYKRGRNAKVGGVPKSATVSEYHSATGLETLFGWLYLSGRTQRINELFSIICKGESNE